MGGANVDRSSLCGAKVSCCSFVSVFVVFVLLGLSGSFSSGSGPCSRFLGVLISLCLFSVESNMERNHLQNEKRSNM